MIKKTDIAAFLAASFLVLGWLYYDKSYKDNALATDWFVVRNLSIPDFPEGGDPTIIYDRQIKRSFPGSYIVEVKSIEGKEARTVCAGSGSRNYDPKAALPSDGVTLSWFLGTIGWEDCKGKLKTGRYYLAPIWEIRPAGYPIKNYTATSNIFSIYPAGSLEYIPPEVIEQLDEAARVLREEPVLGAEPLQ